MSNDPSDPEPLTPNHFLLGRASPNLPPDVFPEAELSSRKHWRHAQAITSHFWCRWMKEYLPTLTERRKWNQPQRNLRPNDVVAVLDPTNRRGVWKLARVVRQCPSPDGVVRTVIIRMATVQNDEKRSVIVSELQRPAHFLCLLLPDGDVPTDGPRAGYVPESHEPARLSGDWATQERLPAGHEAATRGEGDKVR